jgi:glycosyltransferase involved in cell wall biosynthesis
MGARSFLKGLSARLQTERDWLASRRDRSDVAVFHEFHPPPYGGGNQMLLALVRELQRRGLAVETNRVSGDTKACLFNSFNFDFRRLRRFARSDVRMAHRVDGPVGVYRGFDDGTDRRIAAINELAHVTILQSRFSLEKHAELGLELRNPIVVHNAVDPEIFHPPQTHAPLTGRRVRLIATSWSANPRKGADVLTWVDQHLDFDDFEVTFAGNTEETFERIGVIGPLPSVELADVLRSHDVYLAASRDDPCSNALLEGLACGLPAAFLRSGGHPELVGAGGVGFDDAEELPTVLARLRDELDERRARIHVPSLADVADRYIEALKA